MRCIKRERNLLEDEVLKMISVIFITHNRKDELFRAIESCFRQTYKEFEIIIIDNASDVEIADLISSQMQKYKFKNYRYYFQKNNLGVAGGRNLGLKTAKGEYCFFLDDDAVLNNENAFELALADFKNDNNVAAVACEIYQPLDNKYLPMLHLDGNNVLTYLGGAHFIRKACWHGRMLYPDNIMYGSEELYVGLYVSKIGKTILYDSSIKVDHLPSKINRMGYKERVFNIIVNIYICRKYYYPALFLPLLTLAFYLHLIKNGLFNYLTIKNELTNRYKREYKNSMTIRQFVKYCWRMKLKNIF